jgi:hypothetical protein
MGCHGLDSSDPALGLMASPCKHGNEPSGSVKCWEILEELTRSWLLKKDSAPRSYVISYFFYLEVCGDSGSRSCVRGDTPEAVSEQFSFKRTRRNTHKSWPPTNFDVSVCQLTRSRMSRSYKHSFFARDGSEDGPVT